jgi:DNA repair exonuclease SbcCD ATPase subunit
MQDERSLSRIEGSCNQLLNSPYLQKEVPTELKNLRTVLEKVTALVREDVPSLVSEIRHLRNQIRKLEAELESYRNPPPPAVEAAEEAIASAEAAQTQTPESPEPALPNP